MSEIGPAVQQKKRRLEEEAQVAQEYKGEYQADYSQMVGPQLPGTNGVSDAARVQILEGKLQHLRTWMAQLAEYYATTNREMVLNCKRLFVGGLPDDITQDELTNFLNDVITTSGANVGPGPCLVSCIIKQEKNFAFIEVRNAEEATNVLALDGVCLRGEISLKIKRPTKFDATTAACISPVTPDPTIDLRGLVISKPVNSEFGYMNSGRYERNWNTLYIGGLPMEWTEPQVAELLVNYGKLKYLKLMVDKESGRSRGYAFCEYHEDASTTAALQQLNGYQLMGRFITVNRPMEHKAQQAHMGMMGGMGRGAAAGTTGAASGGMMGGSGMGGGVPMQPGLGASAMGGMGSTMDGYGMGGMTGQGMGMTGAMGNQGMGMGGMQGGMGGMAGGMQQGAMGGGGYGQQGYATMQQGGYTQPGTIAGGCYGTGGGMMGGAMGGGGGYGAQQQGMYGGQQGMGGMGAMGGVPAAQQGGYGGQMGGATVGAMGAVGGYGVQPGYGDGTAGAAVSGNVAPAGPAGYGNQPPPPSGPASNTPKAADAAATTAMMGGVSAAMGAPPPAAAPGAPAPPAAMAGAPGQPPMGGQQQWQQPAGQQQQYGGYPGQQVPQQYSSFPGYPGGQQQQWQQ